MQKPGRDPRESLPPIVLRSDVLEMKDLKPEMELTGTVRNVVDFGAFVDIGVHEDGLVHISQLGEKYVKHPSEVLKVGDIVRVKVLEVDQKRGRISLTMRGVKQPAQLEPPPVCTNRRVRPAGQPVLRTGLAAKGRQLRRSRSALRAVLPLSRTTPGPSLEGIPLRKNVSRETFVLHLASWFTVLRTLHNRVGKRVLIFGESML